MTAELLRRAATKLREHGEAATPGPWNRPAQSSDGQNVVLSRGPASGEKEAGRHKAVHITVDTHDGNWNMNLRRQDADAAYITLMHPPVALALADVLDGIATFAAANPDLPGPQGRVLVLARAILREEP